MSVLMNTYHAVGCHGLTLLIGEADIDRSHAVLSLGGFQPDQFLAVGSTHGIAALGDGVEAGLAAHVEQVDESILLVGHLVEHHGLSFGVGLIAVCPDIVPQIVVVIAHHVLVHVLGLSEGSSVLVHLAGFHFVMELLAGANTIVAVADGQADLGSQCCLVSGDDGLLGFLQLFECRLGLAGILQHVGIVNGLLESRYQLGAVLTRLCTSLFGHLAGQGIVVVDYGIQGIAGPGPFVQLFKNDIESEAVGKHAIVLAVQAFVGHIVHRNDGGGSIYVSSLDM